MSEYHIYRASLKKRGLHQWRRLFLFEKGHRYEESRVSRWIEDNGYGDKG